MRTEDRLVTVCACEAPHASVDRTLRALPRHLVDWRRLVRIALENRVIIPVARRLSGERTVPSPARRAMAELALRQERLALRRIADFERALPTVLRRNRVVLLRGIAYAYTIYRNRPARPVGDIDLLIDRPTCPSLSARLDDHCHVPSDVRTSAGGAAIEYHHDLNRGGFGGLGVVRFDMGGLWARRQPLSVNGLEAAVLGPEDSFVYAAVHNVVRGFTSLYRFVDLLEITRQHRVRWEDVLERAAQYGASRGVWMNCHALNLLCEGAVPADVVRRCRPHPWVEDVALRLFRLDSILHDPNPALRREGSSQRDDLRKQLLRLLLLARRDNWVRLLLGRGLEVAVLPVCRRLYAAPRIGRHLGRARARLQGERPRRAPQRADDAH